jgi:hypothetical protein
VRAMHVKAVFRHRHLLIRFAARDDSGAAQRSITDS